MSKVIMTYDKIKRKVSIQGQAEIMNDNQKILAENSFNIAGEFQPTASVFRLTPETKETSNSNTKPVIRAQATCLAQNLNNETDCSNVVIDFFIAYKQKIYSEQMEVKHETTQVITPPAASQTPSKDAAPETTVSNKKNDSTNESPDNDLNSQAEGDENSVPGRYVGQAENTDLNQLFVGDEILATLKTQKSPKNSTESSTEKADPKAAAETNSKKEDTPKTKADPKPDVKVKVKPTIKTPEVKQPETKPEPKTETPKDKTITTSVTQTTSGILRPVNQAVGRPESGSLRNATSLLIKQQTLNKNAFFEVVYPERGRYFATYEMAEMLTQLGDHLNLQYNKKLAVSDISKLKGGLLLGTRHKSHQIGMDADLGYPSTNDQVKFPVVVAAHEFHPSAFSVAKTNDLLKFAFNQDIKVDRIFVDRMIKKSLCDYAKSKGELVGADKDLVKQLFKNMQHLDGHGNHFHLRLKCTSAHPLCQEIYYTEQPGCE